MVSVRVENGGVVCGSGDESFGSAIGKLKDRIEPRSVDEDVRKLMSVMEKLPKISEGNNKYELSRELFEMTNLRKFFNFVEKKLTNRVVNRVIEGVVTFW